MPSWGDLLKELKSEIELQKKLKNNNISVHDTLRRRYLDKLSNYTKRNTILYASAWEFPNILGNTSISEEDLHGFMETVLGLKGDNLDIILHSPGGSPFAVEGIVKYIRSKFKDIRVIVPMYAFSAGTMFACASNKIIMGKHSFLGPIDPQFSLNTHQGFRTIPAQAILDQFEYARDDCKKENNNIAWRPILEQYGPSLLQEAYNAIELSKILAKEWLCKYHKLEKEKANEVSNWLSQHNNHKAHGRHISAQELEKKGLKIERLEENQELQDLVLSLFHATTITFQHGRAVKIIENNLGRAYINPPQQR